MIVWIGSGVPMLKFDRFSKSAGVLLVLPLGVGGSLSQILIIFQKYDEFDIVSKPKVLPPPPGEIRALIGGPYHTGIFQ